MGACSSKSKSKRSTILILNDDCLLEIFKYLRPIDLATVADVCARFRQNAQRHYANSKFTKIKLPMDLCRNDYRSERRLLKDRRIMRKRTASILRNFGPFITSVNIRRDMNLNECIELINRYCSDAFIEFPLF